MKQLYPPPGSVEEPPPEGSPKALPFASRRTPRGPMMREPNAEPPPKGKVRQLYPPPEFDAISPAPRASAPLQELDEERSSESIFVSGAEELDERRRLARERAAARRGEGRDAAGPPRSADDDFSESPVIRPPFAGPFDDEEL